MNFLVVLALALAVAAFLAAGRPGHRPVDRLRRLGRSHGLVAGLALIALLAAAGRLVPAVALAVMLLALYQGGFLAVPLARARPRPEGRRQSVLRSPTFEVLFDEISGEIGGRVLKGTFAGRDLTSLTPQELLRCRMEVAGETMSRVTLEVYLDRRMPGWREDMKAQSAAGSRRPPNTGAMSEEEAYQILGLEQGAGEAEIRSAHRRLMKRVHPDQGGSNFLACRINQAKDRLLSKHR